jgi:hypothetical protein
VRHLIYNPVRRYDFVEKLEWFLVSAVATILVIRTQLWLTNYPQLGGSGLHIAHLLYGGIFMAIAIWISVIYLNRRSRAVTAVIGGVGFGFFIDELGKFITSDNDYFFKPAAGIIYLIFILMFLLIRELSRRQTLDPRTALANALAFLPSTVIGDFQQTDRRVVGELLDRADQNDPLVARSRTLFEQAATAPVRPPSQFSVWITRQHDRVTELSRKPWFRTMVICVIAVWAFVSLASVVTIEINVGDLHDGTKPGEESSLSSVLRSLSILASTVLVGVGVVRMLRGQHQRAYRAFSLALLVSIFITRFFFFLDVQFAAVFGLFIDLLLLGAIAELSDNDSQKKDRFGGLHNGLHAKEEATG